jgi:hypothetical protein
MGEHRGNDTLSYTKRLKLLPSCDVLVAGGGIAGAIAAIAAARAGANTVLIEGYGILGGTPVINAGQHYCFSGDSGGQGEVFDELVSQLESLNATVPYEAWLPDSILEFDHETWDYRDASVGRYFDATVFPLVLQEMTLREKNLRLMLHTHVVDAVVEKRKIAAVIIHNRSGLQAVQPQTVVDCTGDANLAAGAGFPCTTDETPIPMSLCISLRDVGEQVTPVLPAWGVAYESPADLPMVALTIEKDRLADFRSKVIGYDPVDADAFTQAELSSRRKVLSIVHYLQTHGYPTHKLDSISAQLGIRIGRRIVGEYTLSVDDVRSGAQFDDAVARGTANLTDMNLMDGSTDKQTHGELAVEVVPAYQIPYRSLVPRGSSNLLVAGRCMSADSWALSSARMMPTCAMMGQAAGIAAAWSAKGGHPAEQVDVAALQSVLRAKGAEF